MPDTVFKLEYMNDIRIVSVKTPTVATLYDAFQKKFNLKDMRLRPRFLLKFLDMDGDWVTIADDDDISLCLERMKGSTVRVRMVDSYQTANSAANEEWDLRPLFAQLLHSPAVQTSISKMVENILTTSNQVVEVRTKPDSVKMPSSYTTTVTNESLPTLSDEDDVEEVD